MTTTKLFWYGDSQAVSLPREIRFSGDRVQIRREGQRVIIEPMEDDWAWLDNLGEPDPSWAEAIEENRKIEPQKRDWDFE